MTKLLLVFGTRPEAIKMFPVVHALRGRPGIEVRVCVTGQHRELLDQVLATADLRPDIDLGLMAPGRSLCASTASLLAGIGEVIEHERPDRVIVQGDTGTAMAGALAAYQNGIPVAHVEAGLRSGDIRHPWPEEVNRRIVATIAGLHFAPTDSAAAALRAENVAGSIHVTGNTGIDALRLTAARLADRPALARGLDPVARGVAGRHLILVTAHRRENHGPAMVSIARAILRIAARPDVRVLLPLHPNPAAGRALEAAFGATENVVRVPALDYPHFVRALSLCHLVLTDSGGVQEEAPALGKPVLVMRETTERPEGVAAGTARLVGTDEERIVAEVFRLLDDPAAHAAMARAHNPYGDGHAADRIAAILARSPGESGQGRCDPGHGAYIG